ncbi:MAG TPA: hypothetical protein VMG12_27315, partial [Polyangiaceae bacterium]|nr:hypothetical protein [Polyangiaceae bacterium]
RPSAAARPSAEKRSVIAAKPAPLARPRPVEVATKAARPVFAPTKPKATNQPTRKGIDQEFGF